MVGVEEDRRRGVRMAVLLTVTFLGFVNYTALLSVVPLWAAVQGAPTVAVGGTTGVMMAATVVTQLANKWLFRLLSLRAMMILGPLLMGLPTFLYPVCTDTWSIMLVTVVRGAGFSLVVGAGATLVPRLAPPGRLGRSVAYYGVAGSSTTILGLAGGVWVAQTWGFPIVFVVSGAASLVAAVLAVRLPAGERGVFDIATADDARAIAGPLAFFLLTAGAYGAATTFLPVSGPGPVAVGAALFAVAVALVVGRLVAGLVGDRFGTGRLLPGWVLSAAVGSLLVAVAIGGPEWLLPVGGALLGLGFGACQNDSLVLCVERLGAERTGTASTVWNVVFDGGVGLGAVVLGGVIGVTGYGGSFLTMAVVIALVVGVLCLVGRPRRVPDEERAGPSV